MPLSHLVLIALIACAQDTPGASQLDAPGGVDQPLSQLTLDELILRVPKAGCEYRCDPESEAGVEHPVSAELKRRLLDGERLSDAQWAELLRRSGAIIVRDKWPAETPFAISMTEPLWLGGYAQIRVTPDVHTLRSAKVGELSWSFSGTWPAIRRVQAKYQVLGTLQWSRDITFNVVIERGSGSPFESDQPAPGILWEGQLTFPVSIVPTVDDAIPPATSQALDEAVKHSIGAGERPWYIDGEFRSTTYVVVDPDTQRYPILGSTGLSLRIELLREEEVAEQVVVMGSRLDELAVSNSVTTGFLRFYGTRNLRSVPPSVLCDPLEMAKWKLVVTGVADQVLGLWDARSRWGGSITIPLAEAVANEQERTGPGGRGPVVYTPSPRQAW